MKIQSSYSGCTIEFDDYSYDNSLYFIISVKLNSFTGDNGEVSLFDIPMFVEELDAFITDRSLEPKLKGSHGFELSFDSKKSAGHPWVKVSLCNYGNPDNEDNHEPLFCVSGEFEVHHEYLSTYLEYFKKFA